jgi:integrase
VAKEYPEIAILPADEEAYRTGKEAEQQKREHVEVLEQAILVEAQTLKHVVLEGAGNDAKYVDLLGDRTLHQALDGYAAWIREEKFDKSEGAVNDTGMTRLNMVKQLKTYLIPNRPLSSLTDFAAVDQLFAVIRRRPVTFRYQKPMAKKTASNLIGELGRFFDWLHKSPEWDWRKPPEFSEISRSPFELESDLEAESKEVPTYTVAQLRTLFEYGTPLERLLILLGINCAFGADQIGRLRIGEIVEKKGVHFIMRVRRKQKVRGIHRLFAATVEGLRWAMKGREDQKSAYVLVNGKGRPLWRKTSGGNRSKDIPNAWNRLLDRVCEDQPDFPRYGFNTLRDTSANMVRRLAGPEIASVHLTHRHQSSDRNLRQYTNVPRKKLFKAHQRLERKLATVFTVQDAWNTNTSPNGRSSGFATCMNRVSRSARSHSKPACPKLRCTVGFPDRQRRKKRRQSAQRKGLRSHQHDSAACLVVKSPCPCRDDAHDRPAARPNPAAGARISLESAHQGPGIRSILQPPK